MLNFYRHYTTIYRSGKEIKTKYCGEFIAENQPEDFTEELTWKNLTEKYDKNGFNYPFNIWNLRRGRRVSFFNDFGEKFEKDIKEWETPLNISVKHEYQLYNPSIEHIMKFPDGEKAIQYLVERGIAIVGK